jgi:Cu/Ag efflux pump CusA
MGHVFGVNKKSLFRKKKEEVNMIKVIFKDFERSILARDIVLERLSAVVDKFPDLATHKIGVTLYMTTRQPRRVSMSSA